MPHCVHMENVRCVCWVSNSCIIITTLFVGERVQDSHFGNWKWYCSTFHSDAARPGKSSLTAAVHFRWLKYLLRVSFIATLLLFHSANAGHFHRISQTLHPPLKQFRRLPRLFPRQEINH
ncbi:hypothetical protein KC19_11G045300 [Ceratodon purpureus]|uniref:Uncharacterized protein n=1 Tax=Ceratodon purpureus TaxID=3225 RepID=A0A8T0GDA3_CERPU|nr:hypothetical protein KC19_11G045300 [Ceratodon purpureus]